MPKLVVGATQVVTCRGPARGRRGPEMAQLEVLEDDPAILNGLMDVLVGTGYGLVDAVVAALLFGWLYNLFARRGDCN